MESSYLFDIDTLLTERETILQQESQDRALASTIETPNPGEFGEKLRQWAAIGFPDFFPTLSFTFGMPKMCSDGVSRPFYAYFQFLTGRTLTEQIEILQSKLKGIRVDCEYTSATSFVLRVSKA
jgi:hypothetical protein